MLNVIVVPETEEFKDYVLRDDLVFINLRLGVPRLDTHEVRYVAPCWIEGDVRGVQRIYHVLEVSNDGQSTVLKLGNSFVLDKIWDAMGQHRVFEYHPLKNFGYVEVQVGHLMKYKV